MFSTTTAISVLGWDGKVRTILSSSMPNAGEILATQIVVFITV